MSENQMNGTRFSAKLLCEDTWLITGGGMPVYLLAGDSEALVIDTGTGTENLRAFAQSVCGKPVRMAANTNGRFESCGGDGYFDYVFASAATEEVLRESYERHGLTGERDDFQVINVKDGGRIRIGSKRELEVFILDGCLPGATAFLDQENRVLFTGGNVAAEVGVTLVCGSGEPQPDVLQYAMAIARLMARRADYDFVCTGDGSQLYDAILLERHLEAALRALEGEYEALPSAPGGCELPEPEYKKQIARKGVKLVFDERRLQDGGLHEKEKGC